MHELPCFHMQSAKVNFLSKQSAGGVLLRQLGKIFGRIGFELLDAGLAAKFDLLAVVNLVNRLAHAAKFIAADEAGFERVGSGSS